MIYHFHHERKRLQPMAEGKKKEKRKKKEASHGSKRLGKEFKK
jgi:hypothetical protein